MELPIEFSHVLIDRVLATERKDQMWVNPNPYLLRNRKFDQISGTVFVVQAWDLKDSVLPVMRGIIEGCGFRVTHASDRQGQVIFEDIWILLNESEAVLVDFTKKRPNVYLEYGMALVLGKPIIAVTQDKADLPSDTPNLKYIEYPATIEGRAFLEAALPAALRDTIEDFAKIKTQETGSI